jgi:hypothetical protein
MYVVIAFLDSFVEGLKRFVVGVVGCCQLPEDGELFDCSQLGVSILAVELASHDFRENAGQQVVKLFQKLHNLLVLVRFIQHGPEGLNDITAEAITPLAWKHEHLQSLDIFVFRVGLQNGNEGLNRNKFELCFPSRVAALLDQTGQPLRHLLETQRISISLDPYQHCACLFDRLEGAHLLGESHKELVKM